VRKRAISPSIPPPGPYSLSVSFQQAPGHVYAGERSADKEDTNIHTHTRTQTHRHKDTDTHTNTHTHTHTFFCKSASHSCDGFTGRIKRAKKTCTKNTSTEHLLLQEREPLVRRIYRQDGSRRGRRQPQGNGEATM